MNLQNSLLTWAALRAPIVKPRTREYHQELIEFVSRNWPEKFHQDVESITEQDVGAFAKRTYFHLLDGHSRKMASKVRI